MTDPIKPLLVDSNEVARMLGYSPGFISKVLNEGRFPPPVPIGRFNRWSRVQIENWANAGCPIDPAWQKQKG